MTARAYVGSSSDPITRGNAMTRAVMTKRGQVKRQSQRNTGREFDFFLDVGMRVPFLLTPNRAVIFMLSLFRILTIASTGLHLLFNPIF